MSQTYRRKRVVFSSIDFEMSACIRLKFDPSPDTQQFAGSPMETAKFKTNCHSVVTD